MTDRDKYRKNSNRFIYLFAFKHFFFHISLILFKKTQNCRVYRDAICAHYYNEVEEEEEEKKSVTQISMKNCHDLVFRYVVLLIMITYANMTNNLSKMLIIIYISNKCKWRTNTF